MIKSTPEINNSNFSKINLQEILKNKEVYS